MKAKDLPNGHPFTIPDGYFEQLPGHIMERIAERPVKSGINYYQVAAAACLTLLLCVIGVRQAEQTSEYNKTLRTISSFDEEVLIEAYLNTFPATEAAPSEVESYLMDQVDESLLIEEL